MPRLGATVQEARCAASSSVSAWVLAQKNPATSNPRHLVDNMGAASGRLPDEAARQRMIEHIESLG